MTHASLSYAASRARTAELHRAGAAERRAEAIRPGRPRLLTVVGFIRGATRPARAAGSGEPSLSFAASSARAS
jgi:hypothetical protein